MQKPITIQSFISMVGAKGKGKKGSIFVFYNFRVRFVEEDECERVRGELKNGLLREYEEKDGKRVLKSDPFSEMQEVYVFEIPQIRMRQDGQLTIIYDIQGIQQQIGEKFKIESVEKAMQYYEFKGQFCM